MLTPDGGGLIIKTSVTHILEIIARCAVGSNCRAKVNASYTSRSNEEHRRVVRRRRRVQTIWNFTSGIVGNRNAVECVTYERNSYRENIWVTGLCKETIGCWFSLYKVPFSIVRHPNATARSSGTFEIHVVHTLLHTQMHRKLPGKKWIRENFNHQWHVATGWSPLIKLQQFCT